MNVNAIGYLHIPNCDHNSVVEGVYDFCSKQQFQKSNFIK